MIVLRAFFSSISAPSRARSLLAKESNLVWSARMDWFCNHRTLGENQEFAYQIFLVDRVATGERRGAPLSAESSTQRTRYRLVDVTK